MKKVLLILLAVVVTASAALYLFRDAVIATASELVTADMFVDATAATRELGVPVGERIPRILVVHAGETVTDVGRFLGPNGLVLFANRSVVW
jgi:hypothetical protein